MEPDRREPLLPPWKLAALVRDLGALFQKNEEWGDKNMSLLKCEKVITDPGHNCSQLSLTYLIVATNQIMYNTEHRR